MRAAVLREGKVEVRETDDPVPGPGQILVKTCACGICASDLHFMDNPEAVADDDSGLSNYDPDRDIVMGHEYVAEIIDYGPQTERKWAKGTRVSSLPILITPEGARVIGYSPEVPGGYGEYFLMSEAVTRVVDSPLPDEIVALADAISVGWHYANTANMQPNEVALVIGCGAIGLAVIASLRRLGVGPIVAADFVESRRQSALAMGADVVVDPAQESPYKAWRDLAYGEDAIQPLFGGGDVKKCVAFECVGIPGVLNSIVTSCERGTRILSAGGAPEGEHLHTMAAKRKGLNMHFGGGPSVTHWNEALEEVMSGRIDVTPMTGRVIGLDEVPQALDDSRDASGPARIVVQPWR